VTDRPWDRPPEASADGAKAPSSAAAPADPIRRTENERRPKRRLFTFWRVVTLIVLGLVGWGLWLATTAGAGPSGPHVARFDVLGVITVDDERDALIREIAEDPDARALILRIDSPGGTATGAEALYDAVRAVAENKPVVALMGEVAASGGYIAAIAADHVVSRGNTLTGSIGVVAQYPDFRGLLDRIGVSVEERRSDVYKARPSPFSETPPEVEAWQETLLEDSYVWFRDLVGLRRGLSGSALEDVADGRVFTGRQAQARGLIDALGGPEEARDWLTGEGIDERLPVVEREVPREVALLDRLLGLSAATALRRLERLKHGPRLYAILD